MSTQSPEAISVFDMLKIGVGPSSSHTLGPWRAIQRWVAEELGQSPVLTVQVHLYGSLALTGQGHSTDIAICLALLGEDPVHIDVDSIAGRITELRQSKSITVGNREIPFDPAQDIVFHGEESLPQHPNGMRCVATCADGSTVETAYFSVGGGFVLREGESHAAAHTVSLPYPAQNAKELLRHCTAAGKSIAQITRENERTWRTDNEINQSLDALWAVMLQAIHRGCHSSGELPGGLQVLRRAPGICQKLLGEAYATTQQENHWLHTIKQQTPGLAEGLRWLSCFAMAVNEENANLGRVVTAPTNGAAGVIPAVLLYHVAFNPEAKVTDVHDFLLVAGEIGTHFKKGATISAAMGGCQAEIGVSSAMAAAALTEVLGGSVRQAMMAAEIAMEHHLGLTCDPVGGLVQVPCIERNTMGAVKAVNAAQIALVSDPDSARVSLDAVIRTMDQTARDMSSRYKETSQAGLAVNISVGLAEC